MRITLTNHLFTRPLGHGPSGVNVARLEFAFFQELTDEAFRLFIFAEQYYGRTHSSHPRAIASEIDSPSTPDLGFSLTRTGPSPSRKNHLPLDPAM